MKCIIPKLLEIMGSNLGCVVHLSKLDLNLKFFFMIMVILFLSCQVGHNLKEPNVLSFKFYIINFIHTVTSTLITQDIKFPGLYILSNKSRSNFVISRSG